MCSTFRSVLYDWVLDTRNFLISFLCSCERNGGKETNKDRFSVLYKNNKSGKDTAGSSIKTESPAIPDTNDEIPKIVLNDPDVIQVARENERM